MLLLGVRRIRSSLNALLRRPYMIARRLGSRSLVLAYHRVATGLTDPQLLCVRPERFHRHLEYLRRTCLPISLRNLGARLASGHVPHRAVALTFDDGYADNLHLAKPILEAAGVCATVFVATGYLGQEREFWWDELERVFLLPESLPSRLELRVNGRTRRWWPASGNRRHVYDDLYAWLRPLDDTIRWSLLAQLAEWAGVPPGCRASHRPLTPTEVSALNDGGLVEIGAHTVTHPVLAALPLERQRWELEQSKLTLQDILGRVVTSVAYPYGSPSDYNPASVDAVRGAGFTLACSNFEGWVTRKSSPFELPRYLVRDWDEDEFAERLEYWFRG